MEIFIIYLIVVSLVGVILTCYDKIAAKKLPKSRIRERTLFIFAVLGASLPMLITMSIIRHKTKHKRFMLGLPLIFTVQSALFIFIYFYVVPLIINN